ncbi:hypothetical protein KPL70_006643 [Citrus sinensis]|uniref:DExH14 plug domain-containing protein n=1 Tax=Citrus clementina TaxID=85681 RepID=V4VMC8_CITCL|nr:hypothetical protein CICLE_v10020262mg [Citrus x clementina]KAH9722156.1 hypothetical protein KPL70_006643 [Citrus sinensis]
MLLQLPRLTNSLREPFDIDQAYLQRKSILQNLQKPRNTTNSLDESETARKIVYRWEEASTEVRQVYKQFIGAVVEFIDGEMPSEEFGEIALSAYHLFGRPAEEEDNSVNRNIVEKKSKMQTLIGHAVSDASVYKVASLAQRLSKLQPSEHNVTLFSESLGNGSSDDFEFGSDLVFQAPARFLVDGSFEDGALMGDESIAPSSFHDGWYDGSDSMDYNSAADGRNFNLSWLRDACDRIVRQSISQLSRDDLAMAICRVLDSDKPGEEIAGDLLDLVGDSAFETVQDLISHRKQLVDAIRHGMLLLKSEKTASNSQSRMPSYGTQVTVQTESERQIDKLRRKEEKRHRRGTEYAAENDVSSTSFSSLIEASERKNPLDGLIGSGQGSMAVTALPQGTVRKHLKGYEEVIIPPTPTAQMKPGEKLVPPI